MILPLDNETVILSFSSRDAGTECIFWYNNPIVFFGRTTPYPLKFAKVGKALLLVP
jgi:hypothetical protein